MQSQQAKPGAAFRARSVSHTHIAVGTAPTINNHRALIAVGTAPTINNHRGGPTVKEAFCENRARFFFRHRLRSAGAVDSV